MLNQILKACVITIIAVLLATLARAGLRRWFPSLYTQKQNATQQTPKAEGRASEKQEAPERTETKDKDPPYPTGKLWTRSEVMVVMSDGSRLTMAENVDEVVLKRIERHFIDYQGKRLHFKPHAEALTAAQSAANVPRGTQEPPKVPPAVPENNLEKELTGEKKSDSTMDDEKQIQSLQSNRELGEAVRRASSRASSNPPSVSKPRGP